jgi:hypothetical protein
MKELMESMAKVTEQEMRWETMDKTGLRMT